MTLQPYCVGLTGGIGSGKSTVAQMFAELGAELIDTDSIAHQLTGPNGAAMPEILEKFGAEFVCPSGGLDRAAMRDRVFSDPAARKILESILHPLIRAESLHRLTCVTHPYALLIVPLLVENLAAYRPLLNRIAVVDCAEADQLFRTAARPGVGVEQARAILAAQASPVERMRLADDVIDNRGDLAALRRQVVSLHEQYLELSGRISFGT
jgi:dephospho-CoA kinase